MPSNERIRLLRESLNGELYQDKLELLAREFGALCQDNAEVVVFFVLQNVCNRIVDVLEGEAVSLDRFNDLTSDIAAQMASILLRIEQNKEVSVASLDSLVGTLFRNIELFRS